MGQVEPTPEEIRRRLGRKPQSYLLNGGYAKRESIDHLTDEEVSVYAPVQRNPKT